MDYKNAFHFSTHFKEHHETMTSQSYSKSNEVQDQSERKDEIINSNLEAKKLRELTADLLGFFRTNQQIAKSLVERRKTAMKIVLETFLSNPEGDMCEVKLPQLFDQDQIDQRYFIYDAGNCTIKPITPLAIATLKEVFDHFEILDYLSWKYSLWERFDQ